MTETAFAGVLEPESIIKEWNNGEDLAYAITYTEWMAPTIPGWYCGYVMFPKRPVEEDAYDGVLIYVPVHGGITMAAEQKGTGRFVYGFDCNHAGDEYDPNSKDLDWLTKQCELMGEWIRLAVPVEAGYNAATTNEEKARILDDYRAKCFELGEPSNQPGISLMLNVITGQL